MTERQKWEWIMKHDRIEETPSVMTFIVIALFAALVAFGAVHAIVWGM